MTCRSCGHTIADNAIVCYKCGAPTAIPEVKRRVPAPAPGARPPLARIAGACLFLAVTVLLLMRSTAGSWLRWAEVALAVVFVVVIARLVRRR